MTKIRPQDEN